MYQTDLKLQDAAGAFNPVHAAELALRGAGQLYELNVSATRVFLQAQANAAAAFGVPDFSPLFDLATDQTRQLLTAGTEQVLGAARRASDATAEMQRNAGQLMEAQATQAAEQLVGQWAEQLGRGVQRFNEQAIGNLSQLSAATADATSLLRPDMPLNPISEAAHAVG